jgi:hypothetical protein
VGGVIHPFRRPVFGGRALLGVVVLSSLRGTGMASNRAGGLLSPRSLRGLCGVPALVRVDVPSGARSLPVPPRDWGEGEVVR